jgi:hypothetical protein
MPHSTLTHLPPTGERLLTPPLGDDGARLALEGVFTFAYTGLRFDALYQTAPDGAFTRRHPYLQWSPREPLLEAADPARHRYQFLIPPEWKLQGQSLGLRVDVDRFVDEFLIPPSEVRAALTGEMTLRLLPPPAASLWPLLAATSLPATALAGSLGWLLHRRMTLQGLPPEVQIRLDRINRQHRAARAAMPNPRLEESLRALHAGAWTLARQIRSLQTARSRIDGVALNAEAERLDQEIAGFTDTAARASGQAALLEKRKALALLEEMERAQTRSTLRLATLEATLDTACLTLQRLPPEPSSRSETALLRDLDAELTALAEVEREIASLELLR